MSAAPHADGPYPEGFNDGYRVGPDGVEPDGQPATRGYNEDLFGDPEYRRGLSEGRSARIDEQLQSGDLGQWPGI